MCPGRHRVVVLIQAIDHCRALTFVPQSRTTGSWREGWIPAHRVVMTSLATEMRMAPTP